MRVDEIKVGDVLRYRDDFPYHTGFRGKRVKVLRNSGSCWVALLDAVVGDSSYPVGHEYIASYEWLARVPSEADLLFT